MSTPAEHTYEEMERLIHKLVWEATRRYGLPRDDVLEAAHWGFVQAYHSFTPGLGYAFDTWMGFKIDKRIKDLLRQRATARKFEPVDPELIPQKEVKKFDVEDWLEKLGEDARLTAGLVLSPPMDVLATLAQIGTQTPADWRLAVREFLRDVGWNHDRMMKAFTEIKETK
jgi:hypothetical protein